MNEQLENCPFCGTRAQLYREMTLHKVICLNATCTAHETAGFADEQAAIDAWNKRANDKQHQQDIQQLEVAVKDMSKVITEQAATITRLRVALGATQPPPAVAPYHRLNTEDMPSDLLTPAPLLDVPDPPLPRTRPVRRPLKMSEEKQCMPSAICYFCNNQSDDLYLLPDGMFARLCTACALHHRAILAD